MIKYTAEIYTGTSLGRGFLKRVGWQIVATDPKTGKRRYVFPSNPYLKTKSPCLKSQWLASHYKTGLNKADAKTFKDFEIWAKETAALYNERQPY